MKFLFVLLFVIPALVFSAEQKNIKPVNIKKKIVVNVNGNERTYYILDGDKAALLILRGPGKLKICTRAQIMTEGIKEINYMFRYRVNGGTIIEVKILNNKKSKSAQYLEKNCGIPGAEETSEIKIPNGENSIEIWGSRKVNIAGRFLFTPTHERKTNWVSLTPAGPNEPVNIVSGEEISSYYRFSQEKPLKLKINGPTRLRLFTRVENHYDMKGRILYRLQVKQDGTVRNTFQLNSLKSHTAVYQNDTHNVPGRAKEIIIDVPKGSHQYEFIPLDKDKGSLLGKVLFPKKDIKLEE